MSSAIEKIKKHTRNTADKKKLRATLKILESENYFESIRKSEERISGYKTFHQRLNEEGCQKEKISVDKVKFYKSRSKELAKKNFSYFVVSMSRDILLN